MSAEFKRNVWLELTTHRLIAAPLLIGLVLLTTNLLSKDAADFFAAWGAAIVLIGYGANLAFMSVAEELSEKTWDTQRISAIRPWQMLLGKLFGGTIFAWYCFGWLAGGALLLGGGFSAETWIVVLLLAILIHAVNLLSIMLMITAQEVPARAALYSQSGALLLFFMVAMPYLQFVSLSHSSLLNIRTDAVWWGLQFMDVHVAVLAVFTVWAVVGAWRVMQQALAVSVTPWLWVVFLVWVGFFAAGFDPDGDKRFAFAFIAMLPFVYAIAFYDPRSIVAWRRWCFAFNQKDWFGLWCRTPAWLSGLLLCAIYAIPASHQQLELDYRTLDVFSLLLFATRDIALMHLVSFQKTSRNRNAVVLVYLFLLYSIAPMLMGALNLDAFIGAFVPLPKIKGSAIVYPMIALQTCVFVALALRQARLAQKKLPDLASAST